MSKFKTGKDILSGKVGVGLQDVIDGVPRTEIAQNRVNSNPRAPNNGTATTHFCMKLNALIHEMNLTDCSGDVHHFILPNIDSRHLPKEVVVLCSSYNVMKVKLVTPPSGF